MKTLLKIGIIVLILTAFACKNPADGGSSGPSIEEPDIYADATDSDPKTLQAIINEAADGATIGVIGTFTENVTINKPLTFRGYGASGGTINGGRKGSVMTVNGAGIEVIIEENMTLTGGLNASGYGGAIDIFKGTVILRGGNITGNGDKITNQNDGSISIDDGATFRLERGFIQNNTGRFSGGVYLLEGGTFIMDGGSIINNVAGSGGGLYLEKSSTVVLNAGTITGNRSNEVIDEDTEEPGTGFDIQLGNALFPATGATLTIYPKVVIGTAIRNTGGSINRP